MLGEDDSFKVVLDPATDPGADKRGLLRSGQVLRPLCYWRGHRRSLLPADPAGLLPQRRWHRRGSTHLVYRYLPPGSNLPSRTARPSRERPAASKLPPPARPPRTTSGSTSGSGYTSCPRSSPSTVPPIRNSGTSDPTCAAISSRRKRSQASLVGQLPAMSGCPRSRFAETWDTDSAIHPQLHFQPHQRRHRIRRPGPQAALHRQPLLNMDLHLSRQPQHLQRQLHHLPRRVPPIGRHPRVVRGQPHRRRRRRPRRHRNQIVQLNRLVNRRQRVKTISAAARRCRDRG